MKNTLDEIIKLFEEEFKPIRDKFVIIKISDLVDKNYNVEIINKVIFKHYNKDIIWHPGCYLFYGNGAPYKVGRHLQNARKRATEHITDGTNYGDYHIKELGDAEDWELVLFTLIDKKDAHWAAAVEVFLERRLRNDLRIRSLREG